MFLLLQIFFALDIYQKSNLFVVKPCKKLNLPTSQSGNLCSDGFHCCLLKFDVGLEESWANSVKLKQDPCNAKSLSMIFSFKIGRICHDQRNWYNTKILNVKHFIFQNDLYPSLTI